MLWKNPIHQQVLKIKLVEVNFISPNMSTQNLHKSIKAANLNHLHIYITDLHICKILFYIDKDTNFSQKFDIKFYQSIRSSILFLWLSLECILLFQPWCLCGCWFNIQSCHGWNGEFHSSEHQIHYLCQMVRSLLFCCCGGERKGVLDLVAAS